jgi:hypothetical protein
MSLIWTLIIGLVARGLGETHHAGERSWWNSHYHRPWGCRLPRGNLPWTVRWMVSR